MKKVIVNRCYGGYGWSNTAINEYLNRAGIECRYMVDSDKIFVKREGVWTPFYDFLIERDDEVAISVLEDLGWKACSNIYSHLCIEEYDDTKYTYEISEYDGLEQLILTPIVTEDFLRSHTIDEIIAYLDETGVLTKPAQVERSAR